MSSKSSRSAVVAGLVAAAVIALLPLVTRGGDGATASQALTHSAASTEPTLEPDDALAALVESEARIVSFKLQMGLGRIDCVKPCAVSRDLEDIVGNMNRRCAKVAPLLYREWPGYDPAQHDALIFGFDDACKTLLSAGDTETSRRDAAERAVDQLSAAGVD